MRRAPRFVLLLELAPLVVPGDGGRDVDPAAEAAAAHGNLPRKGGVDPARDRAAEREDGCDLLLGGRAAGGEERGGVDLVVEMLRRPLSGAGDPRGGLVRSGLA